MLNVSRHFSNKLQLGWRNHYHRLDVRVVSVRGTCPCIFCMGHRRSFSLSPRFDHECHALLVNFPMIFITAFSLLRLSRTHFRPAVLQHSILEFAIILGAETQHTQRASGMGYHLTTTTTSHCAVFSSASLRSFSNVARRQMLCDHLDFRPADSLEADDGSPRGSRHLPTSAK